MKKISLIIPCYNVENLIGRCLESVVAQTIGIDNLEIILVNDASTDNTLNHLLDWEKKYPDNIMVITYEQNLRQGGARNAGLQYASGDYIGFLDSDDWIEPQMYEELYHAISESDADYSQCKLIGDNGTSPIPDFGTGKKKILEFDKINNFYWANYSEKDGSSGIYGGIVTKLFRRDLIFSHDIWFPEHISYEDNYWSNIIKLFTRKVCLIDRIFYHYCINKDSTTRSKNQDHHFDRLDIEVALLEKYKNLGAFDVLYDKIMLDFIQRYYLNTYHILFMRFTVIPDAFSDIRNVVMSYFPNWVERCNELNPKLFEHSKMLTLLATREHCSTKELMDAYLEDRQI